MLKEAVGLGHGSRAKSNHHILRARYLPYLTYTHSRIYMFAYIADLKRSGVWLAGNSHLTISHEPGLLRTQQILP